MISVDTYVPCTIWQCDRCLCSVWIEDHKNAIGRFHIHAAVDPECKHIFVETVHGSDVCVDISCIGKAKRRMGFAEGDQSFVIALKQGYKEGVYSEIANDVVRPSAEECAQNGRARSTKMRWAVRAE